MGRLTFFAVLLAACGPANLEPFQHEEPPPEMPGALLDLHIEGFGFEVIEGALVWVDVEPFASPPLPTEVIDGEFVTLLPAAYEPELGAELEVWLLVDYGHDGVCDPEDEWIFTRADILGEADPAIAIVLLNDGAEWAPCDPGL